MKKDIRRIIAKEIELGFLRVPVSLKKYFPKIKDKVPCAVNGRFKELTYNPKYGRLFGLVDYFRKNKATPNDIVEFEIMDDNRVLLKFEKIGKEEKEKSSIDIEDAKEIINVSELPSQIKGNIVEQRIAELILLYGQGLLNVYKPISDIEGIDLIVVKRGIFQPIFIQVKSRYNLRNDNIQVGIKYNNFKSHHSFFVVAAYFNPKEIDIHDYLIFISSEKFKKTANVVNRGKDKASYVLRSRLNNDYKGKFSEFVIKKENLVNKIFEKFNEIEKYIK
jgi:hypothetical protein